MKFSNPMDTTPLRSRLRIRTSIGVFAAAALPLLAAPAFAVDIADAYAHAQSNDPVLSAAQAGYRANREMVPQARSGLMPRLSLGGTLSRNERSFPGAAAQDLDPTSPTFGQLRQLPSQNYTDRAWQAQLNQPVVNVSAWFDLGSAKSRVQAAEAALDAASQNLILRVVQAYLDVLRAQDRLEAAQAQETAVGRQLEQVQQRFEVGLVAITDVLEARAAYDNAAVARIQAEGDLHVFFNALTTLTGEDYQSLDRLAEALPIINPAPADEQAWVDAALDANLNVLAAQAQLEAADRNLAARRAAHLPTLDGSISHSYFQTGGIAFLGDKTETTTYALTMSLPVYQGGFTHSRRKEARALADQARDELLNQQLTVTRDARSLFQNVATDVVRVGARRKAIASSQSALEATETGYEVGTRNIVDVLQAQQRLYASQFDYADSRYSYVIDLMALKQVAGALMEEDVMELNQFADPANPVLRSAP